MAKKKVAFHTLGCKLNFSETSTIKRDFEEHNFDVTDFDDQADVYVINTCSVTVDANRDARKSVRRALRKNPDAFVAVVGCYAQLEPEQIAEIEGVDVVLGAKDKFKFFDHVKEIKKKETPEIFNTDVNEAVDFHNAFSSDDRTRAFMKVQDGCDYHCAFCTIPMARGNSRSPKLATLVDQAKQIVDDGYKEIVVTGVNAGDFGAGTDENFFQLLQALDEVDGLNRVRISSIEPNLLHEEIIHFAAESKTIQPHFHIPLQSGSDKMLRLMRRRYLSDLYRGRVELIKKLMPHACIGVDVITGHHGETQELFDESYDFIKSLDVSYLHVFTYSERPNTRALNYTPVIQIPDRKKRTHLLRRLSTEKRAEFDTQFDGQTRLCLFEGAEREQKMYGWTDNYLRVEMPYNAALVNQIVPIKLTQYDVANQWYTGVLEDQNLLEELVIKEITSW